MPLSHEVQYAVRGVFELARRWNGGPVKINDLAAAQAVPPRFLEVILHQLKRCGIVETKRGSEGGYFLCRPPASITVGEVIRLMGEPLAPVQCTGRQADGERCDLYNRCVFLSL